MGRLDCCQFVRQYAQKLTGRDYGDAFTYASQAEADAIMAQHGGLLGLMQSILGEPHEPEPGDVVVAKIGPGTYAAGVWQGSYIVGVHPTEGVVRFRGKVVGAWSCHN
jgi:hypothetical protein